MTELEIKKAKLIRVGNSFAFTIPVAFVRNKMIDPDKKYLLRITEVAEDGLL